MTETELHNANNHMRGTEYSLVQRNPNDPVRKGVITIDGVVMRFVVYPERISKSGKPYSPMKLEYMPDAVGQLRKVNG